MGESSEEETEAISFPEYADDENKKLYLEIVSMKSQIKQLEKDVVDRTERKALMKTHYESIIQEVQNSQVYQNQKQQEIAQLESQMKISLKQREKLRKEQEELVAGILASQERLNS